MSGSRLEWVGSADAVPESLWARCFPEPLEGRWWYRLLERSGLESQFRFGYGLIHRGSEPVGIVPTFLMDVPMDVVASPALARCVRAVGRVVPALRHQRTLFVGSPCADEGTIGLCPGTELASVAPDVMLALEERRRACGASMIVLKDMPEEAISALSPLRDRGALFSFPSPPSTRLSLPAGGFDAYVGGLASRHRHNLLKKISRGSRVCALECSVVQQPDEATLGEMYALFMRTYEKGRMKFERLSERFFHLATREACASTLVLRRADNGAMGAFMLCFRLGGRVINKFIGLDYDLPRESFVYYQLWRHAVQWASTTGAVELQSGQTGYSAKLRLGHALVRLDNFARHRNPLAHRALARVARRITWASLDPDLAEHLAAHPRPGG